MNDYDFRINMIFSNFPMMTNKHFDTWHVLCNNDFCNNVASYAINQLFIFVI